MRRFGLIVAPMLTGGCGGVTPEPPSLGQDELAASIRNVGFECGEPVEATESGESWRIRCNDGATYVAFLGANGDICFEPVIVGDTSVPTASAMPEPRCMDGTAR